MASTIQEGIKEEEINEDDSFEGAEPGARNLDESLFAAESFEDLSHEVETNRLDGECSSRTVSISSADKRNKSGEGSEYAGSEDNETKPSAQIDLENIDEGEAQEEAVDEARLKRAESIIEPQRQNSVEDVNDKEWKEHKKHIFILSEAGKPIYTRYGNEENLVTMMGLMQAIVSFVQDNNDNIRSISAGKHKIVFLVRGPIILVAVSQGSESQTQLVLQLTYVYHQVLSVLTFTQLTRIFEHRRNYDLRKLLAGTEKFIDNLLNLMGYDASFMLQSVRCLPLSLSVRDSIGQALQNAKSKVRSFGPNRFWMYQSSGNLSSRQNLKGTNMSVLYSSDCIQTNNASVPISASKTIMSICKESLLMINSKNRVAFDSILRIKVNCRKDSDIQYSSRICKTGEQKNYIFEYLIKSKYLFIQELVFAILVADNQLVTMVRPKKFSLHPSDLHLIFNLVSASTAFRTAESWTPICLPRFDNSGYLHAHISYLDDTCNACLLLLSTDRDAFFPLSECKLKILERMERGKFIKPLSEAIEKGGYKIQDVGISQLWHFIYKSRSTAQFTSPEMGHPFSTQEQRDRLFGQYLYLHHRMHSTPRPLKRLCHTTNQEMLIGSVTTGFELYAAFSPLTSKATAMNAITKLLRWIKKEEDTLFILNSHTF